MRETAVSPPLILTIGSLGWVPIGTSAISYSTPDPVAWFSKLEAGDSLLLSVVDWLSR